MLLNVIDVRLSEAHRRYVAMVSAVVGALCEPRRDELRG